MYYENILIWDFAFASGERERCNKEWTMFQERMAEAEAENENILIWDFDFRYFEFQLKYFKKNKKTAKETFRFTCCT